MKKQNNKNNNDIYLERAITAIIVIVVLALSSALAFKIVYIDGKGSKDEENISTKTSKTETFSTVEKIDEKRDFGSIELTQISDWENTPYEMIQPKQMKEDIENSQEGTRFSYTWKGNTLFEIVASSSSPYIRIDNVESDNYKSSRSYDLNKWSLFKTDDNEIVFASTENAANGLNEEFTFVTFKTDGTVKEQIKYIDLLGFKEDWDEVFTLEQADCTVVRKGTTVKLVRDGKVLDEKTFPEEIKKGWHWATESYFITDDGELFYVLLDKSNWDSPKIDCVKAGENVSEREYRDVAYFGNQTWRMFSNKNGEDIVFIMDCDKWQDCSIGNNRIGVENEKDAHSSYSDWEITKVDLSKPKTFKLEYVEVSYEDMLQAMALGNKEKAYWQITFNYDQEVYTQSIIPGIDQSIFLSKKETEKFSGKNFDIDELDTVREEIVSLYDSHIKEMYENYLKN